MDKRQIMDYQVKQRNPNTFNYSNSENIQENIIRVNADNGISEDFRVITQGMRQGCPLSLVLFNLYLDEVIRIWLQKLKLSKCFKEF